MAKIKLFFIKLLLTEKHIFVLGFLFTWGLLWIFEKSIIESSIGSLVIIVIAAGAVNLIMRNYSGTILCVDRFSHEIYMKTINMSRKKDFRIIKMFHKDLINITKLKSIRKWDRIKTTTHEALAWSLLNIVIKKNGADIIRKEDFNNIHSPICITKRGQQYYIKVEKNTKHDDINSSLVYKYKFFGKEKGFCHQNYNNFIFYDIVIDIPLFIEP